MKNFIWSIIFIFCILSATAQQSNWVANLHRTDGNSIVFTFEWKTEKNKPIWLIKNATEKIKVTNISKIGDSFIVQMPVFESEFRFIKQNNILTGSWVKRGATKVQVIPFSATVGNERFVVSKQAAQNITGRWAVTFGEQKTGDLSLAEFVQKGNLLTGTFLNATGDYRYLEGVVSSDTMMLSAFDGVHAFLFKARINGDNRITDGVFYSSATGQDTWTAIKDANAKVPQESVAMFLKPGEESLDFSFKDLEGNKVAINSERFKNKVVVIQLMGSWCPNCMDETAFLSEYYNNNKQRGVAVVALAYEYSTDWKRSIASLRKFQQRYNVQYPILNTEVTVGDSLRTEKTLPQLTSIKFFPSSIIIDKKGKVRKLDTGFNGPATGIHYLEYKKEFEATIDMLLKEK